MSWSVKANLDYLAPPSQSDHSSLSCPVGLPDFVQFVLFPALPLIFYVTLIWAGIIVVITAASHKAWAPTIPEKTTSFFIQ